MAHQSGMTFSIIDNRMGSYPSNCVEKFLALALSCCHEKPEKRPSMLDVVRELEDILKMMPETDTTISESTSTFSSKLYSSASSSYITREPYTSSNVSGSDLISGVVPSISPRWHHEKVLLLSFPIQKRKKKFVLYNVKNRTFDLSF